MCNLWTIFISYFLLLFTFGFDYGIIRKSGYFVNQKTADESRVQQRF